ncbi:MAG: DUF599 domain-containing protein [Rickettsiales bacterium]|nr:DUF599 domain-containing protein [Pseudomonadota bacterium]MDA0966282.1 DUF599 domain-containing protein [Pseudomonadota bacterium]MDG4543053.1 DUF599 domain-containing protein [Rickettsiales bacterium]MDG4545251.1 DUF599 domain-containing protein [Rickettsiales bacterium]MDG4547700.1 DUF599 domain-containing protein [Rickettsiales bacterium]
MTRIFDIYLLDIIALLWFFVIWSGYSLFADRHKDVNLVTAMHKHRINWVNSLMRREDRLVDIRIIASLIQSATFFASTSILIIGGLFALLGYGNRAIEMIDSLPFAEHMNLTTWFFKTLSMLLIFIFSFFKFTWVIRQFNFTIVLMVSAPRIDDEKSSQEDTEKANKYIKNISDMIYNTSMHFNKGMRSYYFGLVGICWFISPILLMIASVVVVIVLYRREFLSKTLKMLE